MFKITIRCGGGTRSVKTQEAPATGPGTPGHRRSTRGRPVRVELLARICHLARSTPNLLSPMGRDLMRFQMQVPQQQCFNSNSAFGGATVVVKTLLSRKDLIAIYPRKTCLTADFTPCFIGRKDPLAVAFLRQTRGVADDAGAVISRPGCRHPGAMSSGRSPRFRHDSRNHASASL